MTTFTKPLLVRPISAVALPTTREQLLPGLLRGAGDLAVGNLTITAERATSVDFSVPVRKGVVEIVVTGPASPALASLDDLAGQTVHVRRSSSYYDSLARLNQRFQGMRKPEMKLVRFRTLGCYPLSGAIPSSATTLPDIIREMLLTKYSERQGRLIDFDEEGSMETKKREGYF